jgi:hypothetical protein
MSRFSQKVSTLRHEGVVSTAWRAGKWISSRGNPFAEKPLQSVFRQDIIAADWTRPRKVAAQHLVSVTGRPQIAWVVSPPGRFSGGHHTAFRLMSYLEDAGYDLTVFLYSAASYPRFSVGGVRRILNSVDAFPQLKAKIRVYNPDTGIAGDFDAVVASDWQTAYAARRYDRDVPRLYMVQDFEPWFYAHGSDYIAAENSYRLGLHGITVGRWLARKLESEFDMPCDHIDFSVDASRYARTNDDRRQAVGFYVRPSTGRRGTEYGLLALEEMNRRRPEIDIHLFGADMSNADIPFPFVNHGAVGVRQLAEIFNTCAAVLSISLTNPSLIPLELIACGTVPVVNDADCTRITFQSDERMIFSPLSFAAIADSLIDVVDDPEQVARSRVLATSMAGVSWQDSGAAFVGFVGRVLKSARKRA